MSNNYARGQADLVMFLLKDQQDDYTEPRDWIALRHSSLSMSAIAQLDRLGYRMTEVVQKGELWLEITAPPQPAPSQSKLREEIKALQMRMAYLEAQLIPYQQPQRPEQKE